MYQSSNNIGIIAYDTEVNDIYFVRPSIQQQQLLLSDMEGQSDQEKSINLGMYIQSLAYSEVCNVNQL